MAASSVKLNDARLRRQYGRAKIDRMRPAFKPVDTPSELILLYPV
jgi:hypothetical protein